MGDLHGQFDTQDAQFIAERGAELCVFIGDLGDEDPEITRRVMATPAPLKVLLGNHDAWESFRLDRVTSRLRAVLDVLGDAHFAYQSIDLDSLGVSLVGCRPFSWGGPSLRSPRVYAELYGVATHRDSANRIIDAATSARYGTVVLIAHNGPRGLGSRPGDIYGKDFGRPGGDWGDVDLRIAIQELKKRGLRVKLVVAGHMHHHLAFPRGKTRRLLVVKDNTVYVNPARVPRIYRDGGVIVRHYLSILIERGEVIDISELYVGDGIETVPLFARETPVTESEG